MSKVSDLKGALSGVSADATRTANSLAGFKEKFRQQIDQIQELIAGTSTKTDTEVVASLAAAVRSAEETVASLQTAAAKCANYANQI